MYQKCAALWHDLSAAEKQEWEALARPKHMTGFAYWQSQCLRPNPGIYLPLQGGTMSGNIDMAKNRLLRLPSPLDGQEPARRVDLPPHPTFLLLLDTPPGYTGRGLKGVRVNAAEDALEYVTLAEGYTEGARVYHNLDQSIPNITYTALALNTERYDTDSIHDNVANNSRLTCKTAGKYLIVANIRIVAGGAAGARTLVIRLNGVTQIGRTSISASNLTFLRSVSTIYDLAVDDYVEVEVYQNSGGALDVTVNANYSPEFMMQRIG